MTARVGGSVGTEGRSWFPGAGISGMKEYVKWGFIIIEIIIKLDRGDGCTTLSIYQNPMNCAF